MTTVNNLLTRPCNPFSHRLLSCLKPSLSMTVRESCESSVWIYFYLIINAAVLQYARHVEGLDQWEAWGQCALPLFLI